MTHTEALSEAKKRWGKTAFALELSEERKQTTAIPHFTVGVTEGGFFRKAKGQGMTWEEAFAKADKNE